MLTNQLISKFSNILDLYGVIFMKFFSQFTDINMHALVLKKSSFPYSQFFKK